MSCVWQRNLLLCNMSYFWRHLFCVAVQYELNLAVLFITGQSELFLAVSSVLLCSRSYFRQYQLL